MTDTTNPWVDILLDAAREDGFADQIIHHQLEVFSRAILFELGSRRMSTFEAEQYVDGFENAAVAYFKLSTATNKSIFCAAKENLILALTGTIPTGSENVTYGTIDSVISRRSALGMAIRLFKSMGYGNSSSVDELELMHKELTSAHKHHFTTKKQRETPHLSEAHQKSTIDSTEKR